MEGDIMKKGFTLIELLVVVAIIAILSAAGLVTFTNAQQRSRDSRRESDMSAMGKAMEQYYADHSSLYTTTIVADAANLGPYIAAIPADPKNSGIYTYNWGTPTTTTYCFCATLEKTGTGNATAPNCTSYGAVAAGAQGYFCIKNQQ